MIKPRQWEGLQLQTWSHEDGLHPRSLTFSPLKNDGWKLEEYFPFGMVTFQGRTVKLPGINRGQRVFDLINCLLTNWCSTETNKKQRIRVSKRSRNLRFSWNMMEHNILVGPSIMEQKSFSEWINPKAVWLTMGKCSYQHPQRKNNRGKTSTKQFQQNHQPTNMVTGQPAP